MFPERLRGVTAGAAVFTGFALDRARALGLEAIVDAALDLASPVLLLTSKYERRLKKS